MRRKGGGAKSFIVLLILGDRSMVLAHQLRDLNTIRIEVLL